VPRWLWPNDHCRRRRAELTGRARATDLERASHSEKMSDGARWPLAAVQGFAGSGPARGRGIILNLAPSLGRVFLAASRVGVLDCLAGASRNSQPP
jgi:hypothetical protein